MKTGGWQGEKKKTDVMKKEMKKKTEEGRRKKRRKEYIVFTLMLNMSANVIVSTGNFNNSTYILHWFKLSRGSSVAPRNILP